MNFQNIMLVLSISTLSLLMLIALHRNWQLKHIHHQDKAPVYLQTRQLWTSYFSVIFIFCFIQNADYVIALFYVLFVSGGLLLLLSTTDKTIISPQDGLYIHSRSKRKTSTPNKKTISTLIERTLRTINLVLLSPLIGAGCGILYRAYGQTNEVNLLVFTAFIASLCYAICLVYFSCTRRVGLSSLLGCATLFVIATIVALSQKVVFS